MPVIVLEMEDHLKHKDILLSKIEQTKKASLSDDRQEISSTDWNIPVEDKLYLDYFHPIMLSKIEFLENNLEKFIGTFNGNPAGYKEMDYSYWFQQYRRNDRHDWHYHLEALWSCIYYLELHEDNPPTMFRDFISYTGFIPEVKEGSLIIFPGTLEHCSAPNESDKRKTVIVCNIAPSPL